MKIHASIFTSRAEPNTALSQSSFLLWCIPWCILHTSFTGLIWEWRGGGGSQSLMQQDDSHIPGLYKGSTVAVTVEYEVLQ
jgi:hypothetical protein